VHFTIFSLTFTNLHAQTIVLADSVTTDIGLFNAAAFVGNIITDYTVDSDETTTYPFETSGSFTTPGIGYISSSNISIGVLTFYFDTPVEISGMYVWNAYFSFELDHSINDVDAVFYDGNDAEIETQNVVVPIADNLIETPSTTDFTTVSGVSKIELHVNSLHGGNEISLRRIAFIGSQIITGINNINLNNASIYPNPATTQVAVTADNLQNTTITVLNALGQEVNVSATSNGAQYILDVSELCKGSYLIRLQNGDEVHVEKLVIH
jgi:hypothetical protein